MTSSDRARVHPTLDDLARLRYEAGSFSLLPRQPVDSLLSGRYASRLRGRGLLFEELREYRPGDDIRSMDWRATARLGKPQVRIYNEERERPVLLVVDQRSSMFFGSARTTKATAAAELAALGAWRSLESGDRVGAILFGDEEIVAIKPQRSQSQVLRICHELVRLNECLTASGSGEATVTLNQALERALTLAHHDYLVVLITDLAGSDATTRDLATGLAAHNDVLAALVYDPLGIRLPGQPGMEATDGRTRAEVPARDRFAEDYKQAFVERAGQFRDQLDALRIPILPICTHDPVPEQVLAALGHQP